MEYERDHRGYFDKHPRALNLFRRRMKKCTTCLNEYEGTYNQKYCDTRCIAPKEYIYIKKGDR